MPTLTYIDSGVLIAAAVGDDDVHAAAMVILEDANRTFSSSEFVRLETIPSTVQRGKTGERAFYEEFFAHVVAWASVDKGLTDHAFDECCRVQDLRAIDAVHVAAAFVSKSDELITTEKPTKPMARATLLTVTSIHPKT